MANDHIIPNCGNPNEAEGPYPIPPNLLATVRDKAIAQARQDRNSGMQMEYSMLAMLCEKIIRSYGPAEDVIGHQRDLNLLWP